MKMIWTKSRDGATITHDMPRWRIGVRVGRLLFLMQSGQEQMATIRWPPCFALLCLLRLVSKVENRCQVGLGSQHKTKTPSFFIGIPSL